MIDGDTLGRAAKRGGVAHSTAFCWRHRFLSALNRDKPQRLSGIVEPDETFILESFKGSRGKGSRGKLARPSRRRGGHAGKRGLCAEQIPVIVARDRTGATMDAVLPNMTAASMTAAPWHVIGSGVDFCCDGGVAITAFAAARPGSSCTCCPHQACQSRKRRGSTSTTLTPITAG